MTSLAALARLVPAGAVLLFLGFAVPASAQLLPPPPIWQLTDIKLVPAGVTNALVAQQQLGKNGGRLVLQVSGKAGGICPDGFELLDFQWRFDGSIATFSLDQPIAATLQASQAARSGRCALGLATLSSMALCGTSGFPSTLSPATLAQLDADQTRPGEGIRIFAARGGIPSGTGHPVIRAGNRSIYPDRRLAAFCIDIQTPGGRFVIYYFYSRLKG